MEKSPALRQRLLHPSSECLGELLGRYEHRRTINHDVDGPKSLDLLIHLTKARWSEVPNESSIEQPLHSLVTPDALTESVLDRIAGPLHGCHVPQRAVLQCRACRRVA